METISTGSATLDGALAVGGYSRGSVAEIFGPTNTGKSTMALRAIVAVQKRGGTAAYLDAGNDFSPQYAQSLGVDVDALLVSQPESTEQALGVAEALVRSGALDLLVIDTLAALPLERIVERSPLDSDPPEEAAHPTEVGWRSRLISESLQRILSAAMKTNCVVLFVNPSRKSPFWPPAPEKVVPQVTSAGTAIEFSASTRLLFRPEETPEGRRVPGRITIRVAKDRFASSQDTPEVSLSLDEPSA
jgi:recombination protein RecA